MPHPTTRRRFIAMTPLGGLALLAACSPPAPAPAPAPAPEPAPAAPATPSGSGASGMVDEASPQAVALAYVADAGRVDRQKHPNFVPGSACSGCALYQGQGGAATGPCAIFPGQQVAAGGWCSTWAKRA